ncbi:hypothetical protein [Aggregatilinea lenta]|uniref:hypothetical protein n=1 Tax=Aggregatilinea lenta TaxID=913108 RepID=UPI000E5BACFE|nr:hypothetical protein [Aggregatilinea lenta]
MYGTIARMQLKPGALDAMMAFGREQPPPPGDGVMLVFQMDNNPDELYLIVAAESEEAYRAVANSPEQHQRFLQMMELLVAEPDWHDGRVVAAQTPALNIE